MPHVSSVMTMARHGVYAPPEMMALDKL